jgi:Rap guanine nucleotide exchange factor 2
MTNGSGKSSMMDRLLTMLKGSNATSSDALVSQDEVDQVLLTFRLGQCMIVRQLPRGTQLRSSRSNPDIAGHAVNQNSSMNIAQYYQPVRSELPEHVLKIYRSDQSFKYLTIYKETTAQNVVQLALQVFANFMLNEFSGFL